MLMEVMKRSYWFQVETSLHCRHRLRRDWFGVLSDWLLTTPSRNNNDDWMNDLVLPSFVSSCIYVAWESVRSSPTFTSFLVWILIGMGWSSLLPSPLTQTIGTPQKGLLILVGISIDFYANPSSSLSQSLSTDSQHSAAEHNRLSP